VKWPVTSTQDEPILDEETFQQLLAASYTLQQHAGRLLANEAGVNEAGVNQAGADCPRTLSVRAITERVGPIQALPETRETVAHPVSLIEPVLPVAQAVQKQADRLVANDARTDCALTLSAEAKAERDPNQIPLETRETVTHPVSSMEPSQPLNNLQIRQSVMALIGEINRLLEDKKD
jgi:hypothetical protein